MDVREKLVELLDRFVYDEWYGNGDIAEKLISNGVTVQEWISVDDRLPEPYVSVLVNMPGEKPFRTVREGFISKDGIWQSAMVRREPGEVTHRKPLPQPPKGE